MKKKKSVLIIDDESDLCALIKLVFMRENFAVDCALNLAEATAKLPAHPDIILLDNNLPDGLGLEYYRNNTGSFDDSYIIMMTADANPGIQSQAKKDGIDDFIQKPFSMLEIREMARRVS